MLPKTVGNKKKDFKIISVQFICEDEKIKDKADTPYFNISYKAIDDASQFSCGDERLDRYDDNPECWDCHRSIHPCGKLHEESHNPNRPQQGHSQRGGRGGQRGRGGYYRHGEVDQVAVVEDQVDVAVMEGGEDVAVVQGKEDMALVEGQEDLEVVEGQQDMEVVEGQQDVEVVEGQDEVKEVLQDGREVGDNINRAQQMEDLKWFK